MIKNDFHPYLEAKCVVGDDSKHKSLSSKEIEALQVLTKIPRRWLKKTHKAKEGFH